MLAGSGSPPGDPNCPRCGGLGVVVHTVPGALRRSGVRPVACGCVPRDCELYDNPTRGKLCRNCGRTEVEVAASRKAAEPCPMDLVKARRDEVAEVEERDRYDCDDCHDTGVRHSPTGELDPQICECSIPKLPEGWAFAKLPYSDGWVVVHVEDRDLVIDTDSPTYGTTRAGAYDRFLKWSPDSPEKAPVDPDAPTHVRSSDGADTTDEGSSER